MNTLLWIAQILVGLLFLFAGAMKLITPYEDMRAQMVVPLHYFFVLFIGVCEVLGGLGLIIPWALGIWRMLTPLAAILLSVIMVGAIGIGLAGGIQYAILPFIVLLLLIFIAWGRWRPALRWLLPSTAGN